MDGKLFRNFPSLNVSLGLKVTARLQHSLTVNPEVDPNFSFLKRNWVVFWYCRNSILMKGCVYMVAVDIRYYWPYGQVLITACVIDYKTFVRTLGSISTECILVIPPVLFGLALIKLFIITLHSSVLSLPMKQQHVVLQHHVFICIVSEINSCEWVWVRVSVCVSVPGIRVFTVSHQCGRHIPDKL